MKKEEKRNCVPVWRKSLLTVEEASAYSGIGINRLKALSDIEGCEFVLWLGNRRMFKREQLDEYIKNAYSL